MTKKKHFPAAMEDGYKQTNISNYFKIKNENCCAAAINSEQQYSRNKENDGEELIGSPPKKSKLMSGDEVQAILDSLLAPLKTSSTCGLSVKTPKRGLRKYQSPQHSSVNTEKIALPIRIPSYTYSESDSEVHSNDKSASQPRKIRHTKGQKKRNLKTTLSTSRNKKNLSRKPDIKINFKTEPVVISSDEEDFVITPRKTRTVVNSLPTRQRLTAKETAKKVEEFLASSSKTGNTLNQSDTNLNIKKQDKKHLEETEMALGILRKPSLSKPISVISNDTMGVHKPTIVSTTAAKRKPRILQEKSKSNSSMSSTSADYISTDFTSAALEMLPTTIQSISSNGAVLREPSSKTISVISSNHTMSVHKPTIVSTTAAKRKPRILLEKSKSNSSMSSTSADYISTDFTSSAVFEVLSTSIQSISSNDTVIYEQNINFTINENVNSTLQKVGVLESIDINSPTKILEQCNLSPIEKDTRADILIEQNVISSQPGNMKDVTNGNLSMVTKEEFENGNWTMRIFTKIMKYVEAHSHLKTMFTSVESDMLNRFFAMPLTEYWFFCFKLFTRIQKWYNIFKLRNDLHMQLSDTDMRNMYDCLYENKFVEIDFSLEPCIDLLNNLSNKDLKEICKSFKVKASNNKRCEMVQKLLTNCNRQTTLTTSKSLEKILRDRIKLKMGKCVKLSPELYKLFEKVHLLYSLTTSDFVKPSDLHFYLGKIMSKEIVMPKFNVNMNIKIFSSITEFSRFAEACECKRAMVESFEKKEIGHMLELSELAHAELKEILECYEEPKPSYLMCFTAGYKYTKALSLGAKHLARHYPQKVEEWLVCLIEQDQYSLKFRGCWYDLLVMVQYNYLKQYETAANTLIEALDRKDLSDVHLHELSYRAEAIKRSKAHKISELLHDNICFVQPASLREFPFIEIDAQAVRNETGRIGKRLYIEKTEGAQHLMTVEEIALKHYFKNGYVNGLHCEGSLLETIFFVLFWDIIYESAVPDAFILEIQYFPLDLFSQEFYTNRKIAIDKRLCEIQSEWPNEELEGFTCNIWNKHSHEKSCINSRLIDKGKDLYDIILCIGRVKLAQMLERIAKDFKAYHSGLPDLFLWTVDKKQCKFVEVKGEKDKLSTKQKLWLDFLLSVGADAEVCHVHTVGSKTGRKVRRIKKEAKKQDEKMPE